MHRRAGVVVGGLSVIAQARTLLNALLNAELIMHRRFRWVKSGGCTGGPAADVIGRKCTPHAVQ